MDFAAVEFTSLEFNDGIYTMNFWIFFTFAL